MTGLYQRENNVFRAAFSLTFRDCDPRRRIKLSSLLGLSGDIAGADYTLRGLPYEKMLANGEVFLLSRYSFRIVRWPMEGEQLCVRTWERGAEGVHVLRDYIYEDAEGLPCVYGTSAWVIVDPASRRPIRPSAFKSGVMLSSDKKADCPAAVRIRPEEARLQPLGVRTVVFSDLDANGHLSNGKYGDIAADFLPAPLRGAGYDTFEINFIHEALEGEHLEIAGYGDEREYVLAGRHEAGNGFICRFGHADAVRG